MQKPYFDPFFDPWRRRVVPRPSAPYVARPPRSVPENPAPFRPAPFRPAPFRPAPFNPGPPPPDVEPPPPAAPPVEARTPEDALRNATEELEAANTRLERDRERALIETKAQVVEKMLPVLDNLDRSIEAARQSPDAALREGVELVRAQFEDALTSLGLERIPSVGERFDPSLHEAIAMVEVDDPDQDNVVVDEWRRGYKLGGRIVRSPQVRVARLRY